MDDTQGLKVEPAQRTVVIDERAVWRIQEDAIRLYHGSHKPSVPFCTVQALYDFVVRQGGRPGFVVKENGR